MLVYVVVCGVLFFYFCYQLYIIDLDLQLTAYKDV